MIMAYIKRAKHYSIVRGVTRSENGELVDTEVVVDGACRTPDMAMKKARKINTYGPNLKESTGFEPARQYKPVRRISSPVHYHSANSPITTFLL